MKRMIAGLALATLWGGAALAADPAVGQWRTQADDNGNFALVSMQECGATLCATITRAFGAGGTPIQSPNVGKRIVWDMAPQGGGAYAGGKIYAPDRDKTYNSKMMLAGDRLKVEGCVLGICRGQTWARAD